MFKEIKTKDAPAAIGPYSQGIVVGNVLYASGQIPADPATGEVKGDITEQAEQSMKNVGGILRSNGMDYSNVVKTTCYLADMGDFAKFNEVYAKYFSADPKPARSCVAVKAIPKGCLCEVEILAIKE